MNGECELDVTALKKTAAAGPKQLAFLTFHMIAFRIEDLAYPAVESISSD